MNTASVAGTAVKYTGVLFANTLCAGVTEIVPGPTTDCANVYVTPCVNVTVTDTGPVRLLRTQKGCVPKAAHGPLQLATVAPMFGVAVNSAYPFA